MANQLRVAGNDSACCEFNVAPAQHERLASYRTSNTVSLGTVMKARPQVQNSPRIPWSKLAKSFMHVQTQLAGHSNNKSMRSLQCLDLMHLVLFLPIVAFPFDRLPKGFLPHAQWRLHAMPTRWCVNNHQLPDLRALC
jgi:hypothetical protein